MDKYQETSQTWNKVAKSYQDKFMNLNLYNDTYDAFLDLMQNPNSSLLEIGCGPGNITHYLLSKNAALKIKGIDTSENMIELAKRNNPAAEFEVMDCRKIDNLNAKYNAIVCGFCIPYLSETDCKKLIVDCKNLLFDAGILYLSFVAGDHIDSGFMSGSSGDRVYFQYHNLDRLKQELEANLFKIEELFTKKFLKSDGIEEEHTIIISTKY